MDASPIRERLAQLRADDFVVSFSFDPINVTPGANGDALIDALKELGYSEFGPQLVRDEELCMSVGPPTIAALDVAVSQEANVAVVTGWPTATATGGSSALDLHLGSGTWSRPDWLEWPGEFGFVPTPQPQSWTWRMEDGHLVAHPLAGGIQSVDISRDGLFAVATETYADSEPLLTLFDLQGGGARRWYLGLGAVDQNITGQVRLSRDDRWALLGSGPGLIELDSRRLFQLSKLRGTFDWDPQAPAGLVGIVCTGTTTACIVRVDLTTGDVTRGPEFTRDESRVPWHGEHQRCIGFSVNAAGTTAVALTEFGVGPEARGKVHGCAAGVIDLQSGVVNRTLPVVLDHPVARFIRSPKNPRWLHRQDIGTLATIDTSRLEELTGGISDPASGTYANQAQFLREIDLEVTARWLLRSIMDGHAIRLGMPEPPVHDFLMAYDLLSRTGNSAGLDDLLSQVTSVLVQRNRPEIARLLEEGVGAIRGGDPGRVSVVESPGKTEGRSSGMPLIHLTGRRLTRAETLHLEELSNTLTQDLRAAQAEEFIPLVDLALRSLPELVALEWVVRCFGVVRIDAIRSDRPLDDGGIEGAAVLAVLTHGPGAVLLVDEEPNHPGHPRVTAIPLHGLEVAYTELMLSDGPLPAVRLKGPATTVELAIGPKGYAQFFEFSVSHVQERDAMMYRAGTPEQTRRNKTIALRVPVAPAEPPASSHQPPKRRPGVLSRLVDAVIGPLDDSPSKGSGRSVGSCPLCGEDIENVMEHGHDHVGPVPDEDWGVAYTFHCCENRLLWPTPMQACAGFTQHLMEHGIDHFANWGH